MSGQFDQPILNTHSFAQRIAALSINGQAELALSETEKALKTFGPSADLYVVLAGVLRHMGQYGSAVGAYTNAAQLTPSDPAVWFGMGICFELAGEAQGAAMAYAKAMEVEPRNADAFFNAINRLQAGGHTGLVVDRLDAADPKIQNDPRWFGLRASAALEMGDYLFPQKIPSQHLAHPAYGSSLLALKIRAMVYDPDVSAKKLLLTAQEWDLLIHPRPPRPLPLSPFTGDRPLRIGFVNSRMRRHNLGFQQLELMRHRPSTTEWHIYLYSSNDQNDDLTTQIAALADCHRDIKKLKDADAAELIRKDNLDILVDYNEYTNDGRLGIFAHRAAPVQVHYLGNALSTGLRAMDYRISDAIAEPEGVADAVSAETIIRLPGSYHFYTPPANIAQLRTETPAKEQGHVTFGAIHHIAKYNDQVLKVYKEILERLPTARLVLARNTLDDPGTRRALCAKLEKAGLPKDRVELRPDRGSIASLAFWHDIDCVLDAFPYGADASAMDSFYAGVPLVTLLGERVAGRRAASMLHQLGCPELISESLQDYCDITVKLANDIPRLDQYRRTLHERFKNSPMCQHAETAANIFDALRALYIRESSP